MFKKNLEKYKTFTLLLVIGCLVILLWFKNQAIESLQSANTEISYEITKDGKFMATQRQNIMDLEEALKKGLLEKEKYMKNVKSQTKFETKTIITEKFIPYHDTVELYFDTLDKRVWVKTPAPIRFQDSFNLFTGKFTKDGFVLDTMETLNIFRVSIFDKKQGLFKKSIPVVEIKSNNPRTQTTEIQNVTIEKKKPFYSKWWFLTGLGMFVGYFVI